MFLFTQMGYRHLIACILLFNGIIVSGKTEGYFLYDLAAYTSTALSTSEFAFCYMRREGDGDHGCKVVPLDKTDPASVKGLARLDFTSPETSWGSSKNQKDLITRVIDDDFFVLCANPECYAVTRKESKFTFSHPLVVTGKFLSLILTRKMDKDEPAKVNLCTRTNSTDASDKLFGIGVHCMGLNATQTPLTLDFEEENEKKANAHLQIPLPPVSKEKLEAEASKTAEATVAPATAQKEQAQSTPVPTTETPAAKENTQSPPTQENTKAPPTEEAKAGSPEQKEQKQEL